MEKNNPLYKNQGVHLISSIFTVKEGNLKVLLIKRNNEPFKDKWALVGGALYNNETIDNGMKREIIEKTGIEDIDLYLDPYKTECLYPDPVPPNKEAVPRSGLLSCR